GTFTNNIDLHPNAAVRTPPSIEPAAKPAESTEMKIPNAPFLSLPSGNVATRIANAVTVDMAAPVPETPLETTNESRVGDRPAARDDVVNRTIPNTNSSFCLYTSPALPLRSSKQASVN